MTGKDKGRGRPVPPQHVLEELAEPVFEPAPEIIEWARACFIAEAADLSNPDHVHLNYAEIGALWTNVANAKKGRTIIGQCEEGKPSGMMGKWGKARAERQILDWFGAVPDFILTFDASYCAQCSDAEFMALVEHELYHCGQDRDVFGAPKFRQDGSPAFTIRGHDIEEFVGVVRRYGADATHVRELVEAAKAGPEIANVTIAQACGTCQLRVA